MGMSSHEGGPAPRLCHIQKWPDFEGFGFNLHAEKGRVGQYVGKVDDGSPAEAAGLKQGDRIIEVNGVNICNENHRQVVARIKSVSDETQLLVVDAESEAFFKEREQVIHGAMDGVVRLTSHTNQLHVENNKQQQQHEEVVSNTSSVTTPETLRKQDSTSSNRDDKSISSADSPRPVDKIEKTPELNHVDPLPPQSPSNRPPGLNMTAAEMRAQLAQRKKFDPKKENMDLRRKFDIVQTL